MLVVLKACFLFSILASAKFSLQEEWSFTPPQNEFVYNIAANMLTTTTLETYQFATDATSPGGSLKYASDVCDNARAVSAISDSGDLYFSCNGVVGMLDPSGTQTGSFALPAGVYLTYLVVGKVLVAMYYDHNFYPSWLVMDLELKELHQVEQLKISTSHVIIGRNVLLLIESNTTHCSMNARQQDSSLTFAWEASVDMGNCRQYMAEEYGMEMLYVYSNFGVAKFSLSNGIKYWHVQNQVFSLALVWSMPVARYLLCTGGSFELYCLDSATGITFATFTPTELIAKFHLPPMSYASINNVAAVDDLLVLDFTAYPDDTPFRRVRWLFMVSVPLFELEFTVSEQQLSEYAQSPCSFKNCLQSRFFFTQAEAGGEKTFGVYALAR